jgi:hypothetical protein
MKGELYPDTRRDWRWRLRARNGRIVAVSGEGYRKRSHARRMLVRLFPGLPASRIAILDG